jgi:hypothetical protein
MAWRQPAGRRRYGQILGRENKGSWDVRRVRGGGFLRVLGRDSLGEL